MLLFPAYCVSVTLSKSFLFILLSPSVLLCTLIEEALQEIEGTGNILLCSLGQCLIIRLFKIGPSGEKSQQRLITKIYTEPTATFSSQLKCYSQIFPLPSNQAVGSLRNHHESDSIIPPSLPLEGLTELYIIISSPRVSTYSRSSGNVITYMIFGSLYRCCLVLLKESEKLTLIFMSTCYTQGSPGMDGGEGQKGAQVQKRKEIHCIILLLSEIMILFYKKY